MSDKKKEIKPPKAETLPSTGGRPAIAYNPEWEEHLVRHMSQGFSFWSFAALIGVCQKTLSKFLDEQPSFLQAKKRGEAENLLWWESAGMSGMFEGKKFNQAVWMVNMRNRHDWVLSDQAASKSEHEQKTIELNYKIGEPPPKDQSSDEDIEEAEFTEVSHSDENVPRGTIEEHGHDDYKAESQNDDDDLDSIVGMSYD